MDSGAVELYDATKEAWTNRWMKLEKYTIRFYNREKVLKGSESMRIVPWWQYTHSVSTELKATCERAVGNV